MPKYTRGEKMGRKIEYYVNNVGRVEQKLHLKKDIRKVKITCFSEKELKEFVKKIPRYNEAEKIKKLEKETGLILKYEVFYDKYGFYEFSKLGIWPDNSKFKIGDPDIAEKLKINYLENYDILVVDRKSGIEDGLK